MGKERAMCDVWNVVWHIWDVNCGNSSGGGSDGGEERVEDHEIGEFFFDGQELLILARSSISQYWHAIQQ